VAINDLLVSMHGHGNVSALRFFPGGWTTGQPVSFVNIRTKGAFLMAASAVGQGDGVTPWYVQPIKITSLAGKTCTVVDPFNNGSYPIVRDSQGRSVPVWGVATGYQFFTEVGGSYTLAGGGGGDERQKLVDE